MKPVTIVGIILIVLAIVAFGYQGITYTKREKVIDLGPLQATTERKETIPLPPVVGAIALVGGIALVFAGSRGR
ncbi:MAG: DUF3185 domain-containing protein [Candidatus Binatia bacterium]